MGIIGSIVIGILAGFLADFERKWIRIDRQSDCRYNRRCTGWMAIRFAGTERKRSDRKSGYVNHRCYRFIMDRFTIQKIALPLCGKTIIV